MSILPLKKVSIFGMVEDKMLVLENLQKLGCMHMIPQKTSPEASEKPEDVSAEDIQRAISHLRKANHLRHQVLEEPEEFKLEEVVKEVIENRNQIRDAEDDIYYLNNRVKEIEPWGNFDLPEPEELAGYRLWFYRVPHGKVKNISDIDIPYCSVASDQRYQYIVLISKSEPPADSMPVARSRTARRSLGKLYSDLQSAKLLKEDLIATHESLSRWLYLLSNRMARAIDQAELNAESEQVREDSGVLLLQGWVSLNDFDKVEEFAKEQSLALVSEDPKDEELPPTIMDNPMALGAGENLVTFYKTPAYGSWDPSVIVFFSFAIFFAMILADAGYAFLLLLLVGYFWKDGGKTRKGEKIRSLALVIVMVSMAYGVLLGSYFGVTPPESSLLYKFKILEINNYEEMMKVSVVVGCLHLTVANIAVFSQSRKLVKGLPSIGWISVIYGGLAMFFANTLGAFLKDIGILLIAIGFLLILFFSSDRKVSSFKNFALRIFDGLISLANISKLFGDTMSYLRLFALGLASSALAVTFNQAATSFYESSPVFGPVLAILVLIAGHLINLVLSVVSCFVHGLRLNVIEFFNWGLSEDGYPFRAFEKKGEYLMNECLVLLGWIGLYAPVALGAIGSAIGCTIAGQAAVGALMELNGGYGRYVGISALPSSMSIYGIVVMFSLNRAVTPEVGAALFVIGMGSGLAFLVSAIYQGQCCASAIAGSKAKPEIFGLSIAPAAIVEGFAVFAFVCALVLGATIPTA